MEEVQKHRGLIIISFILLLHLIAFIFISVYQFKRLHDVEEQLRFHVLKVPLQFSVMKGLVNELDVREPGNNFKQKRDVDSLRPSVEQYMSMQNAIIEKSCAEQSKHQILITLQSLAEYLSTNSYEARRRYERQTSTNGNEMAAIFQQLANSELAIFDKYCGNNSTICLPGPKGDKGDPGQMGMKGDSGSPGDPGPPGFAGTKGEPGTPAVAGSKGEPGQPGPAGSAGEKGAPGFRGLPGQKGQRGDPGSSGPPGFPGNKGDKGDIGNTGPQGQMGVKGEPGSIGGPGRKGEQGSSGPPGQSGPPGLTGPKGDTGSTGSPGFPGQKGDKGENGHSGPPGFQGSKGEPGVPGKDGPPGPRGIQGMKGEKGEVLTIQPLVAAPPCCDSLARPTFNQTLQVIKVVEGSPVTLKCDVVGHPVPQVAWNPPITTLNPTVTSQSGNDLVFTTTSNTDSGSYTCVANSALGTASKEIVLQVYKHIKVVEQPTNHTVLAGQSVVFECKFNGTPTPSITWYHINQNGTKIPITNTVTVVPGGSQLELLNVDTKDIGEYRCEATNGVEMVSQHAYLITQGPPVITPQNEVVGLVGQTMKLHCLTNGYPKPTTTWVAPPNVNNAFEDQNGDLVLLNIQKGDAGPYMCKATNLFGSTSSSLNFVVKEPGRVAIASTHIAVGPSTTNFAIDCKATGEPPLSVQWYHDGVPVNKDPTHVILQDNTLLVLAVSKPRDLGLYTCVASNSLGSDNKTSLVYEDKGSKSCDDPFTACQRLCGSVCPANCQANGGFGLLTFAMTDAACRSAVASGAISAQGGVVVWEANGNTATIKKFG